MSDGALIDDLRRCGGTPPQILAEPELMARLLPIFRADLSLLESFIYTKEPALPCPITAFGGNRDARLSESEFTEWEVHTTRSFAVSMFEGGHFFIENHRKTIAAEVSRALEVVVR
jgi:surfactin synthase thioesterase subunit